MVPLPPDPPLPVDRQGVAAPPAAGRRQWLKAGADAFAAWAAAGALAGPGAAAATRTTRLAATGSPGPVRAAGVAEPFGLGVASGCFGSDRVLIWTRLIAPLDRPGRGPDARPIAVRWTLASDERLLHAVASGTVTARPEDAHAVRVEIDGLAADRWYWYRFAVDGAVSRIGRTRTLPAPGTAAAQLRIAVASCQNYEHGHFAAWRHVIADQPDLVVHVGDYIYETTWGRDLVRPLGLPEARSLDDYRGRYAIYRRDPDLQAAHAELPWAVVWDDHEVMNDYARLTPERLSEAPTFDRRRALAYRAWFEHMPVPATMAPGDGGMRIYRNLEAGDLFSLYLLDCRQYRSVQACAPLGRHGGSLVDAATCATLADTRRTLLGGAQEEWLERAFGRSRSRWNLVAQPTLMSPLAVPGASGEVMRVRTDGWDGYPPARQRLIDAMLRQRLANPVVIGGDLHAFYIADLPSGARPDSPVAAAEFVGTSITSQSAGEGYYERLRSVNEHLRYASGAQRGYLRLTARRDRLDADLVGLDDVRRPDSGAGIQAAWVVEAGRPGARPR